MNEFPAYPSLPLPAAGLRWIYIPNLSIYPSDPFTDMSEILTTDLGPGVPDGLLGIKKNSKKTTGEERKA